MNRTACLLVLYFSIFVWAPSSWAQKPPGMPPAPVKTALAQAGQIVPETVFVGTLEWPEVAQVASEVSGRVEKVRFEEGDRVQAGDVLVEVNADLLKKALAAATAGRNAAAAELAGARVEHERIAGLLENNRVARRAYDEVRFRVQALEGRLASLEAEKEKIEVEVSKKKVRAPFEGVVLERLADRGEWISPGTPVCRLAQDSFLDAMVNVPAGVAGAVNLKAAVTVELDVGVFPGRVQALIPQGDAATRTFPVKVRMENPGKAMAGMKASVRLPTGDPVKALIIPRDAVISVFGQVSVWVVQDGAALSVPVQVLGYDGLKAGVTGPGLEEDTQVVTKGNERLRPGQPVANEGQDPGTTADRTP